MKPTPVTEVSCAISTVILTAQLARTTTTAVPSFNLGAGGLSRQFSGFLGVLPFPKLNSNNTRYISIPPLLIHVFSLHVRITDD